MPRYRGEKNYLITQNSKHKERIIMAEWNEERNRSRGSWDEDNYEGGSERGGSYGSSRGGYRSERDEDYGRGGYGGLSRGRESEYGEYDRSSGRASYGGGRGDYSEQGWSGSGG